jgi:hypothetical protein
MPRAPSPFVRSSATASALSVALLLASPSRANDSTFGGAGADLVPLVQQQVSMQSEDIVLTAEGYDWRVDATYVFLNAGPTAKVQVGFPEYRCEPDSDCTNVAFRGLETTVDGVRVVHRQGKLDRAHPWENFLGVVWLFDVEFPMGKEVRVEHRYRLSSGGNVDGDLFTSYVTRTGTGWAGPIGRAKFTVVLPPYTRVVRDPAAAGLSAAPPRVVLEPTPHVEFVLAGRNWTPKGGLTFSFNASSVLSLEPLDIKAIAAEGWLPIQRCFPNRDPEEAQRCLNELYASKGYPFQNAALAKRYYGGDARFRSVVFADQRAWIRDPSPFAAFSPTWFSPQEAQDIKVWRALVASGAKGVEEANEGELPLPAVDSPSDATAAPVGSLPPAVTQERLAPPPGDFTAPASPRTAPSTATIAPPTDTGRSDCDCRTASSNGAPWAGAALTSFALTLTWRSRRSARRRCV